MTKVTLHYDLTRPLTETDLENIASVHSTYGMARVQVSPSLDKITVDYDASRLMKQDVEAVLTRHGLPIRVVSPAAA
jgi:copper chaperone CopZ